MEAVVRCAKVEDVKKLTSFLEKANLGTEGVKEAVDYFLLLEDGSGSIQATLGIEPHGAVGLLRSLAITGDASEREILLIFEQMLLLANEKHMEALYLATNKHSSVQFFEMIGFQKVERESLNKNILSSAHVKHILTVDNSLFMELRLNNPQSYPQKG